MRLSRNNRKKDCCKILSFATAPKKGLEKRSGVRGWEKGPFLKGAFFPSSTELYWEQCVYIALYQIFSTSICKAKFTVSPGAIMRSMPFSALAF